MLKLLKLEWLKFKANSVIVLLLGFFFLLFPFLILSGKELFARVPPPLPSNKVFYEFPTVWDYQGHIGAWLAFIFIGFIGIFIVTNEVSYKTLRQNIITGLTRKEYFLGKVLFIVAIAAAATMVYVVSTIVIGLTHTSGADFSLVFDNNYATTKFFLMVLGYLSFGLMLGFLFRNGGISIFLYMAYIMFLEPLIKFGTIGVIMWRYNKNGMIKELLSGDSPILNAVNYLPMNALDDLMPLPIYAYGDTVLHDLSNEVNFSVLLSDWQAIIASAIYIALFLFLAFRSFMKKDI